MLAVRGNKRGRSPPRGRGGRVSGFGRIVMLLHILFETPLEAGTWIRYGTPPPVPIYDSCADFRSAG
jgi:hypothetical protein